MKNPNGYGSVVKLSGNRRRPWMVRITTARVIENGKARQIRKVLGYYANRKDALSALARYNDDPYDPDAKQVTFAEVYARWSPEHILSKSSMEGRAAAFKNVAPLHDMPINQIRVAHIESVYSGLTPSNAYTAHVMIKQVFRYAMRHEIIKKDYSALVNPPKRDPVKIRREAFDLSQIAALMKDGTDSSEMILVGILTGFRPQELTMLRTEDVDLEEETIKGGLKTKAGKDRLVPIHPAIMEIIKKRCTGGHLFHRPAGTPHDYFSYRTEFLRTMQRFGLEHTCHDTRHTFVTLAKEAGMDEYILKLIVGHSVSDITERVYTHRSIARLREEIRKIVLPT